MYREDRQMPMKIEFAEGKDFSMRINRIASLTDVNIERSFDRAMEGN